MVTMAQSPVAVRVRAPTVPALFRLWLPTVFGASMLVVEIPVVAAAAARSVDGGRALAAIGIGMSILVVVNTPALAVTPLVAAERARRSLRMLRGHVAVVGVLGTIIVLLTAVPPGAAVVRSVFDLDAATSDAVSAFLIGLAPNPLGVAIRRYQHGRLIHDRRTGPIVWATVARLVSTAAIAWAGTAALPRHGALIAGAALSAGAFLEAFSLQMARTRAYAPPAHPDRSWTGLIVHHGHLSAARLLVMAPTVVTIVGVAHAAQATDSLIVWPVLIQLTALFTSPTTDWESVAATALRDNPRGRAPQRLTVWLATAVSGLFAATLVTGLAETFVSDLLAVPAAAAELGVRWAWLLLPLPALWISRAYLRGVVMATDDSRWLSVASLGHTVALIGVLVVLTRTGLPGVACAIIALVAGVVVETAITLYASCAGRSRKRSQWERAPHGDNVAPSGSDPDDRWSGSDVGRLRRIGRGR
jgi:hypothetical protein